MRKEKRSFVIGHFPQFPFEEIWGFKFEVEPLLVMSEPHATA
jgi:hypothetical protein